MGAARASTSAPHQSGRWLFAMPFVLLLVSAVYLADLYPVFSGPAGYDQDPAYVYLLSGLTLVTGHVPTHVDHPGTPLQALIGIVILLLWLAQSIAGGFAGPGIVASVAAAPESYLFATSIVLVALVAAAAWYAGRSVLRTTGSLGLAVFLQNAPLAFWIVAPRIAYVSPEAVLLAIALVLVGLLMPLFLAPVAAIDGVDSRRVAMWAGLLCGFGIAVKVTFLPMLLLLLVLPRRALVVRAGAFAVAGCLVGVLPIVTRLVVMVSWLVDLAVHSGHYGAGPANVIDARLMRQNADALFGFFPFFYAALALVIVVLVVRRLARRRPAASGAGGTVPATAMDGQMPAPPLVAGAAIAAACLVQTLFVLKHPGPHYLIPALPLPFVGTLWVIASLPAWRRAVAVRRAIATAALVIGCAMSVSATRAAHAMLSSSRAEAREGIAEVQAELAKHPDALVLGTYRCVARMCALAFGAGYAPALENAVAPAFGRFVVFNIWNRKLLVFGKGWVEPSRVEEELALGREVLLLSPDYEQLALFERETIVHTRGQSLYRVRGLSH